jgi:hypothetical protein
LIGDGLHPFDFCAAFLDPTGGTEGAMVLFSEAVARADITVEQSSVVDHAGDYLDAVFLGGIEAQGAWPGL